MKPGVMDHKLVYTLKQTGIPPCVFPFPDKVAVSQITCFVYRAP